MNLQNVINSYQSRALKGCLAGTACWLASSTLSAETLVYDGFGSYAPDSDLVGQGGGTGWTGNWTSTAGSADYFGGSGSIAPDTLNSEDGYAYSGGASGSLAREYGNAVIPTGETEMWFSFAFNRGGPKNFAVNPFSNQTSHLAGQFLGIHADNDDQDVIARIRYAGSSAIDDSVASFTMDDNTDYFIYGQAMFASGSTTLNVWIYESTIDLSTLTGSELATMTVTSTSFDSTDQDSLDTFSMGSGASVSPSLDEIRIGTSFSDVVAVIPEPSSYALLGGVLVLGLAMVRRRK